MANRSTQNTANDKRQWDVVTMPFTLEKQATWGIDEEIIPEVIKVMREKKIGKFASDEHTINFNNLKKLVASLWQEDIDMSDWSKALAQFITHVAVAPKADQNVYKDLQLVINKFPGLITSVLIADGRWGPASQKALEAVQTFYNLPVAPPSRLVLHLLQLIAGRLFGINSNEYFGRNILFSGFAYINDKSDFSLVQATNGYTLNRYNKQLIDFVSYKSNFSTRFGAVTACLMLLQLQNGKPIADVCDLMLLGEQGEWQTPGAFTSINKNDFYFEPDFTVSFATKTAASLTIKYSPKTTTTIELMAIYMNETFTIAAAVGEVVHADESGKTLVFDATSFLADESKKNGMDGTTVLLKADYVKFFILRKKRETPVSEIRSQPKHHLLPLEFYQLITTPDEDILGTACFGLAFQSENKFSKNLTGDLKEVYDDLKTDLKGIQKDLKADIKRIFKDFRSEVKSIYKERKVTVADDLQKDRWDGKSSDNGNTLIASVEPAKLVPGLYSVAISIHTENTALKEAAIFLHDTFKNEIEFVPFKKNIAKLNVTAYEAFTVGVCTDDGTMLELDLNEVPGYPKGFYYDDPPEKFKLEVEELDKSRPIIVPDDLQKNRWEGKEINNGKKISAVVQKKLIPGLYKVEARVEPADRKSTLHGFVAFFLHDSFKSRIRYKKVIDNVAKLSLTAYEAFTISACTQDGTLLELDLQKQLGYPAGFYYKEEQPKAKPKVRSKVPRKK